MSGSDKRNYVLLRKPQDIGNKWEQYTAQYASTREQALRQANARVNDGYDYRVIPARLWMPVYP